MNAYWLLKSEPSSYSIDHLSQKPNETDHWNGVRNYTVRNMIRDQIKKDDLAFFYHSSCKEPGIVGIVKIVRESYPDYSAFDDNQKYYDSKSNPQKPTWLMFDVKLVKKFHSIITLKLLKNCPELFEMQLLKKGNRLSILPISKYHWDFILQLQKSTS